MSPKITTYIPKLTHSTRCPSCPHRLQDLWSHQPSTTSSTTPSIEEDWVLIEREPSYSTISSTGYTFALTENERLETSPALSTTSTTSTSSTTSLVGDAYEADEREKVESVGLFGGVVKRGGKSLKGAFLVFRRKEGEKIEEKGLGL